ncbi:hypothetical protein EYF80_032553 [Liparis tanakae]|uniref:Uncharacterized protein n=1 Tax=Liparis tanakae TaxID=230148 RepID=A0A4Z2GUU9_9TELE|nr:hypothetical protein EYF80_032553 [Liparis tanakae]
MSNAYLSFVLHYVHGHLGRPCVDDHAEGLRTAHLGAGARGGLAHAQHRLVLGPVQPPHREAGAADPAHHGDVAVSGEAMQNMMHGDHSGCFSPNTWTFGISRSRVLIRYQRSGVAELLMLRYASRAPSTDHQWATAGIHPTFISPVREPVDHVLLPAGGREAQSAAAHTRLVVDVPVTHVGLA